MSIYTERLTIEPLSEEEDAFIFELLNTEGWIRYIGNRNINAESDAVVHIQKIKENPATTYWSVKLKETQAPIGLVTLIKRDYLDFHDIGFAFLPAFSGKGYAYEATKAILQHLAESNHIENILAITLPENKSSIKLIKKLGLQFEKIIEQDKEHLYLYSGLIKL